jgi:hypothetical protein
VGAQEVTLNSADVIGDGPKTFVKAQKQEKEELGIDNSHLRTNLIVVFSILIFAVLILGLFRLKAYVIARNIRKAHDAERIGKEEMIIIAKP